MIIEPVSNTEAGAQKSPGYAVAVIPDSERKRTLANDNGIVGIKWANKTMAIFPNGNVVYR